jgi:hypothetical protein
VAGEQRLGELEAVVQRQRNPVARRHAAGDECRAQPGGPVVQLGRRAPGASEHECIAVGVGGATASQQLGKDDAARAGERTHVLSTVHALTPGAP